MASECKIERIGLMNPDVCAFFCETHRIQWFGPKAEEPRCALVAAKVEGVRLGLEAAAEYAEDVAACDSYLEEAAELVDAVAVKIRALDPEAIAKEAM